METLNTFVRGEFFVDCSAELEQLRAGGVELTERDIRALCEFANLTAGSAVVDPLFEPVVAVFGELDSPQIHQLVDLAEKLAGGVRAAFESDLSITRIIPVTLQ